MKRGNAGKEKQLPNGRPRSFHIFQTLVSYQTCQTVRREDEEYRSDIQKPRAQESPGGNNEEYELDRLARRLPGSAQPQVPPSTDTKNRSTAIILALGAVGIAKNHSKYPKKGSSPGEKEECDRQQGGQQKDH